MGVPTVELITREQVDRLTAHLKQTSGSEDKAKQPGMSRSPVSGSLEPYNGSWQWEQAAHLMRRAMIGPTAAQIGQAVDQGLNTTVEILLADQALPDPPINYYYEDDPDTPIGETWVDKPFRPEFIPSRFASLYGWTVGVLLDGQVSVRERMTLFWHNHFVTSGISVPKAVYQYITLLRTYATGNFRELTKEVTLNPSMLLYLNGNENTRLAPNENYARELLELFTVGKGELAGEGDYTTFTEQDVIEMSKVLTGWRVRFDRDDGGMPYAQYIGNLHDPGSKQLSHRFDNAIVQPNGEEEYSDLINIIFEQPEAARHLCRKLYRWFVYYVIDERIEQEIIEPMASILRDNDFETAPVLEALFRSEHFYDANSIGCLIKNPIDHVVTLMKQFEMAFPEDLNQRYALWNGMFHVIELLQMVYYSPPSVAGWKAFYQEPAYNQLWINSVTLVIRQLITDVMSTEGFDSFGGRFRIDVLRFIESIDNATDPNDLIAGIARIIYPVELSGGQIDVLKNVLIPGLPDYEWTFEYNAYLSNPENTPVRRAVEGRVRQLIRAMLARPEYHLA